MKLYRWKIKNIVLQRAEDLLKHSQEQGFSTLSERVSANTLEELSKKSEALTREYAELTFGDDQEQVEKYLSEAKRLTKDIHDSVVIHPRFWAIPQSKADARLALGYLY